jgi:serine/threonine protein kinase
LRQYLKEFDILSGRIELKIADFGFAKVLNDWEKTDSMCGTPLYMAPEILL